MKMFKSTRPPTTILKDQSGISVSIPELVTSTVVRMVVVGGLVAAIGAMLVMSTTTKTSSSTSASFQSSNLRFKSEAVNADVIRGSTDPAVAAASGVSAKPATPAVSLMTTKGTSCEISTWRNVSDSSPIGTILNLAVETKTVAGVCTTSTAIPAPSVTGRSILLGNVAANVATYKNVVGRTITFSDAGIPSLSAGTIPAGVLAEDWQDMRPQQVTVNIASGEENLTTYAKNATLVGTSSIVNYVQAPGDQNYVNPQDRVSAPAPLTVSVQRSTTTGAVYGGVHEGIQANISGGVCLSASGTTTPTSFTLTWAPASPGGQATTVDTFTRTMDGSVVQRHLPGVANGSNGNLTVAFKCSAAATPTERVIAYGQDVPATNLTVRNDASNAARHYLTWTAVSSLSSSFRVEWNSDNGMITNQVIGTTSALSYTSNQPAGTTHGHTTTYTVFPTVNNVSGGSSTASTYNGWPAAPQASGIWYENTRAGGNSNAGNIRWSNSYTCPAGTDLQTRRIDNMRGLSNGTEEWANFYTGPWQSNMTSSAWAPWYALQGYVYGSAVDTKCKSLSTGAESSFTRVQSPKYVTPMLTPSAPRWNGYNFAYQTLPRGGTYGWSTCRGYGGNLCGTWANGMKLDYIDACSPGSWVVNSRIPSKNWNGKWYSDMPFGSLDGWELPNGWNSANVYYGNSGNVCGTPWATSPWSYGAAGFYWTVYRR
jgi:hypothetical protein